MGKKGGGEITNKRISIIILAILAVVMLTTLLLGTVNAEKTIVPFENIPVLLTPSPGDIPVSKLSGDEHLKITTSQNYQGIKSVPLEITFQLDCLFCTLSLLFATEFLGCCFTHARELNGLSRDFD